MMHAAGDDYGAVRLRGLIVVLWRAGLRISEALALAESDPDLQCGAILVRHGKGGKRREVGMDRRAWQQLSPWLQLRATLPVGALFCVLRGPTPVARGLRPLPDPSYRWRPLELVCAVGSRRTSCATRTLWRCHARECRCSSSGDSSATQTLRFTSVYLRGIDNTEIVHAVHERPAPMIPATHGL